MQGQTQGKQRGRPTEQDTEQMAVQSHHSGSPSIPGSPVTYSPQLPMEPMPARDFGGSVYGQTEFAGWAAQPKLVPTVFLWSHGGAVVELEGSFDNWTQRHRMQQSGKDTTLVKLLPPGVYQYKFIVDGQWRHDPNLPCMYDDMGNINNVMEVQEYVPENLDSLTGFEPPPSPAESYNCPLPMTEDFLKEPAIMPPQLQLSLLNVPPALDAIAALPRPQHVVLNHIYLQRTTASTNAIVLGATHRYKSKYITTVMYKPNGRRSAAAAVPQSSDVSMGGQQQGNHPISQTSPMQY